MDASAPELYERYLVPTITSIWAADLVHRVAPQPGDMVLDVACGTGIVARLVRARVGPGRVVGLDLNEGMLAVARSTPSAQGPIEWHAGSALALPFGDSSFSLVLCQLGLQFFPDRMLALHEMKRVLKPGGRVGLSVYSSIERTPAACAFAGALDSLIGPGASRIKRAEHVFEMAEEVDRLLGRVGYSDIRVSTVTKLIRFPSVLDYVRFQLTATPMATLLSDRADADREAAVQSVATATEGLLDPTMISERGLIFPQEAHVAIASVPVQSGAQSSGGLNG